MLELLKFIPGVSRLLTWAGNIGIKLYSAKLAADGAHEAKIVELATREMALDETEARLNAQAKSEIRGHWYEPENAMFYFVALPYWLKSITIDNVIGSIWELGWSTPALHGETAETMMMIMVFWFGKRGIVDIAKVISAAFGKH